MEIIKHETIGKIHYFTIKVVNKLIKVEEVIERIDNIEDYLDKSGNFDKDSFKEDILKPRDYLVTIEGSHTTCTCKNELFRKTTCRHINYALEKLNESK